MTTVKICGLRTLEHAQAAHEAGADYLGLIFAPGRRQVSEAQAVAIVEAVRRASSRPPRFVGVFVNETPEHMRALAERLGLAAIQLSGDEDVRVVAQLGDWPVFKALRLRGAPGEQEWLDAARDGSRIRLLIDAHVPGSYGGAGVVGDWDAAAELARRQPIILAGGLTPENVTDAIRKVEPWGVDVSSGVEQDGVKDSAKIRAFIAAARAVDQTLEARAR